MTETVRNETIRYRNEAFAIHHLIADCPPFTVVRELLKNAEENAATIQPPGRIEWFIEKVGGVPKLGLFNADFRNGENNQPFGQRCDEIAREIGVLPLPEVD